MSLISLSRALLCLGYVDQTRLRRNEMLAEARRLSPYTVAFALVSTWAVDWAIEGVQSAARVLTSGRGISHLRRARLSVVDGLWERNARLVS